MNFVILILIFVFFKDIIFWILGGLFNLILFLVEFIADIRLSIAEFIDDRRRNKYHKQKEQERKRRLLEIETEHEKKNHTRVIALFREVMKDDMYYISDKMKYCHIAADSVCHIAKTVRELEEARTWTIIIREHNKQYKTEADELYNEISKRGEDILIKQDSTIDLAFELLENVDVESALEVFEIASDDGSFFAMCKTTELIIKNIKTPDDFDEAKSWIEKVSAVDRIIAKKYDDLYKNNPIVKFVEHYDRALEYHEKIKEASGDKRIELSQKCIDEWEKAYEYIAITGAALNIVKKYIFMAEEQKRLHPKGNDSFAKHAGYYEKALEWIKMIGDDADENTKELRKGLEAKVELNTMVMNMTKEREQQNQ